MAAYSRYHTSTKLKSLCWPKRLTVDVSVSGRVDLLVWIFVTSVILCVFVLIEIKFLNIDPFLYIQQKNFTNLTELRNALVDSDCYQYFSRPAAAHIWCKVHSFLLIYFCLLIANKFVCLCFYYSYEIKIHTQQKTFFLN